MTEPQLSGVMDDKAIGITPFGNDQDYNNLYKIVEEHKINQNDIVEVNGLRIPSSSPNLQRVFSEGPRHKDDIDDDEIMKANTISCKAYDDVDEFIIEGDDETGEQDDSECQSVSKDHGRDNGNDETVAQ